MVVMSTLWQAIRLFVWKDPTIECSSWTTKVFFILFFRYKTFYCLLETKTDSYVKGKFRIRHLVSYDNPGSVTESPLVISVFESKPTVKMKLLKALNPVMTVEIVVVVPKMTTGLTIFNNKLSVGDSFTSSQLFPTLKE